MYRSIFNSLQRTILSALSQLPSSIEPLMVRSTSRHQLHSITTGSAPSLEALNKNHTQSCFLLSEVPSTKVCL
jgi:hypothetical protein